MEGFELINNHLGSGTQSEKLYELEREIEEKIREAAREWQAMTAAKTGRYPLYWEVAIPSEIATICARFGFAACKRLPPNHEQGTR